MAEIFEATPSALRLRQPPAEPEPLAASIKAARQQPPAWWGQHNQVQRELRVPADIVTKDSLPPLTEVLKDQRASVPLSWAPNLQHRLMDPAFAGVMQNDIEAFAWQERYWDRVGRGFKEGRESARLGLAGRRLAEGDDSARPEIEDIMGELAQSEYRRQPGVLATIVTEGLRQIGQQVEIGAYSLGKDIPTPTISTPYGEAITPLHEVVKLGAFVGDQMVSTMLIESGTSYIEATDLGIEPEEAISVANWIGVTNQLLDYVTLGVAGKIGGPALAAFRGKMKKELIDKIAGRGLLLGAGRLATIAGTEAGTEMLQELNNMETMEDAKRAAPFPIPALTREEVLDRTLEAGVAGLAGAVFLGAPVVAVRGVADVYAARRARIDKDTVDAIHETVKNTEAAKAAPEVVRQTVQAQAESAGMEFANIDVETVDEVLGDRAEAFYAEVGITNVEDIRNDGGVARFEVSRAAINDKYPEIAEHLRSGDDKMSKAESKDYNDRGLNKQFEELEETEAKVAGGVARPQDRFEGATNEQKSALNYAEESVGAPVTVESVQDREVPCP